MVIFFVLFCLWCWDLSAIQWSESIFFTGVVKNLSDSGSFFSACQSGELLSDNLELTDVNMIILGQPKPADVSAAT